MVILKNKNGWYYPRFMLVLKQLGKWYNAKKLQINWVNIQSETSFAEENIYRKVSFIPLPSYK